MVITDLDLAFDQKEEFPSPFDKCSTTAFGLTQTIITMLLNWLDPQAQLNLLYRGSEQGISPLSFHQHCDKKGATLTLVKSDLGKVFGGYTQVSWRSESRPKAVKDNKAFVFSLTHKQRYALKHFNGPAVVHSKDFMAVFGRETLRDIFLQRNDGRMANNNTSDFGANYILPKEMVIGSEQSTSHLSGTGLMFKIAEIEVYQVVIAK
ncbi:hypothetical protein FGO68_gene1790 [Halteria grandinella]|uniref:TLDc domain-containing protein n=1 Tax=Halteria grandinella TaxID=5974 RepID=A0A8J8NRU5_HALGN|nr:hypothetical protein FGO68_gene1790 [Halteria grandinella]